MRRLSLLIPALLVAVVLATPAAALPSHGSQDLVPVAGAPLRDGWVSGVQANGTVYSTGVIHIGGALPNTTYSVLRKLHTNGQGCTSFFANFTLPMEVTTDPAGNATESSLMLSSTVDEFPFLHGLTVGQVIEVYAPGPTLAYSTTCVEYTMH